MNTQTIKLTEEETAIIYQCRQRQLMWETWGRVLALLGGIIMLIEGLFSFSNLSKLSKLNNEKFFVNVTERSLLSVANITAFFILVAGISYIVLAIYYWNGSPSQKLLLKLVDRISNQEKSSETSSSQSP
jgi:hypothetical protein